MLRESSATDALLEEAHVRVEPERLAPRELPGMAPPAGLPESREPGVDQRAHWEAALRERPDRYGAEASEPARVALTALRGIRARTLLELGSGQGRDALFFAQAGLAVKAADFASVAITTITEKARASGVPDRVVAVECDVRQPLPFPDQSFDACYSHMLFCMALSTPQLRALATEVWRVLRPGGLCIYTARTSLDPDYGRGTSLGGDLYELDGFVVHFFTRELVERLAAGSAAGSFELLAVEEFEEGELPRRLIRATMRRPL